MKNGQILCHKICRIPAKCVQADIFCAVHEENVTFKTYVTFKKYFLLFISGQSVYQNGYMRKIVLERMPSCLFSEYKKKET